MQIKLPSIEIGIAVAQETVAVAEGVGVDVAPRIAQIGGDEQQKGAFRLVEVGDDGAHHLELVRRHNHQAGGAGDAVELPFIQVTQQCLTTP